MTISLTSSSASMVLPCRMACTLMVTVKLHLSFKKIKSKINIVRTYLTLLSV